LDFSLKKETGMNQTIKVSVLHLMPAPYRIPLFERLLADRRFEARIFFTDRPSRMRPDWSLDSLPHSERVVRLSEIGVPQVTRGGDKTRLNTQLNRIFDWHPDVVLIYGYNEPTTFLTASICAAKRIPFVVFAEVSNETSWSLRKRVFSPILGYLLRKAAWLVPASMSGVAFFEALGCKREKMTVIPCVPDVTNLIEVSKDLSLKKEETKARLGLDGRFVVLFVGRLIELKGVRELVQAADLVASKAPEISFVVVGYGPLEEYVQDKCSKSDGKLIYEGFKTGPPLHEFYSIADLHVMPSWYDAYGLVCPEALSFGVPSVVTSTCGCKDLIREGENGMVIRPRDAGELARAVLKTRDEPELLRRMKANASDSVRDLTMDRLYSSLCSVILASARPRHPK
jgi:glycosyltransferase involved in cell wall biosynthesis